MKWLWLIPLGYVVGAYLSRYWMWRHINELDSEYVDGYEPNKTLDRFMVFLPTLFWFVWVPFQMLCNDIGRQKRAKPLLFTPAWIIYRAKLKQQAFEALANGATDA